MKLSIVDISTVPPGKTRHDALMNSIDLAKHVESWGYSRIWVAEHHNAAFIAGRAPEVLIAAIAAATSTIRVGSGSVLLNHYSAYKVAEVFCTLNELYPGRIDLGAGRATTGPVSDYALQQDRSKHFHSDSNQQIAELVAWLDNSFPPTHAFSKAPLATIESKPELHLLGSSSWSATAAAALGLRYVFAGFINQAGAASIIKTYRDNFEPADAPSGISTPEVMLAVHVVCADTDEEAQRLLAPVNLMYRNLGLGNINAPILHPDDAIKELGMLPVLSRYVKNSMLLPKFIGGSYETVSTQLKDIAADFGVGELLIQDMITGHEERLHSFKLLSGVIDHN